MADITVTGCWLTVTLLLRCPVSSSVQGRLILSRKIDARKIYTLVSFFYCIHACVHNIATTPNRLWALGAPNKVGPGENAPFSSSLSNFRYMYTSTEHYMHTN